MSGAAALSFIISTTTVRNLVSSWPINSFSYLPDHTDVAASSELCTNQRDGRIVESLWLRGAQRGCIVQPKQIISINSWITFPRVPLNIPIKMNDQGDVEISENKIYMLIEAKLQPEIEPAATESSHGSDGSNSKERFMGFPNYSNNLFIEEFGSPLAWKVDTHFAFLFRTDEERLTKFILATFMSDNFSINNDLQLLRIESE